ncbi:P-loop containing nucleoside triphosphate hydrolase protein [Fimicolochytrium jonesii]|uniref:P-loop containing nucleoside triphosphate hydrolase protein n=1 Tax=Fimicolochytrium jonesii TaxID=1396493 RepID=UPI0022FE1E66|nr:P-loop containing nucleoside triphosphate hydrolase protein [Fimicolochytrium jonesii]KAI8819303.1 P-loop containing nucleoside triphosphate hydrolase protein [Fimicolochytrium jonesii]
MAAKADPKVTAQVGELITKITTGATSADRAAAAKELASVVKAAGAHVGLTQYDIVEPLTKASTHKKSSAQREGSMLAFTALAEALGHSGEPYLVSSLPVTLELFGDKDKEVKAAAEQAADALFKSPGRFSVKYLVPLLLSQLTNEKKWQTKVAALKYLGRLSEHSASQVCAALPLILPVVSTCMWDTKPEVQAAAKETMTQVTGAIDNIDIIPFLPALIGCIANPDEVPECVFKLAATTFVTEVQAPTLAIMVPLLQRGLSERKPAVLRQTCVIIDNMCKLVENPAEAHQFLPPLLPGVDRIIEVQADPELRSIAARGKATLIRVGGGADVETEDPETVAKRKAAAHQEFLDTLAKTVKDVGADKAIDAASSEYIVVQLEAMYDSRIFDVPDWHAATVPYATPFIGEEKAKALAKPLLAHYVAMDKLRQKEGKVEDLEEGEELCNCEFSLAYGGMILLNNTKLRLIRGQRYGLCGPNGVGKSTLMRAIANGQLDGFPPADELKTVFVEHTLQAEDADLSVLDFVLAAEHMMAQKDVVEETLRSVGFDDGRLSQPVGSLSGGWKMKLELARAMLEKADILLLDEPTNHLDVANVTWLVNYLTNLPNVTSMIVSHDSGFLDRTCTNIIHYENRKLKTYRGNLSKFVEQKPEAKSYYELSAATVKFKFPEPGFLEGIKSKDKAILKMIGVNFTYPGRPMPALTGISLQCSLNSRVAVIGPNGAGKSTMIKILTGELVAVEGDVWKHPNLRVAYVAQHAFHHVEQHMDKTPNEYIRWRYQYGEDRESLVKAARQLTPEEEAAIKKPIVIEAEKRLFEDIVGRRKAKRSYEYEIKWLNRPHDDNTWHSRDRLEDWGFEKLVNWFDEREAAKEGMYARPLTQKGVEKHLEDVGLPAEFATHSRIRGLSGGQKVKVVLGAAMWNNPHMLVLDEPTNYLDRDSLGALAGAIQDYGGGVVIISHNREFTGAICPEVWNVDAGKLRIEGAKRDMPVEKIEMKEQETVTDAFGNVTKVKSKRKLTRKELKQKEKRRADRIKAQGEAGDYDSEEED